MMQSTMTTNPETFASRLKKKLAAGGIGELVRLGGLLLVSRWKLRQCTTIGSGACVWGSVHIENAGQLHIGERVRLRGSHVPVELATAADGKLTIGEGSYINSGTSVSAASEVRIGKNVAIGNYVLIMDSDFHDVDDHRKAGKSAPIIIEDDVWIAAKVTILKGVRIGQGAVVAAGAVVTKDVPPRSVVGGIPARVLRMLTTDAESSVAVGNKL